MEASFLSRRIASVQRLLDRWPLLRHPLLAAGLLLGWMALIFWLSSQPSLPHPNQQVGVSDHLTDYVAHGLEYGVLTVLAWWLARAQPPVVPGWLRERALQAAMGLALLYALSDEFHQSFVPGRCATLNDILADSAGILLAAVFLLLVQRQWRAQGR